MDTGLKKNDFQDVVDNDRAHVWHHLSQHKELETVDPLIIIEGKGNRIWNQAGREHLDCVSGGVWTVNVGYGRETIANAVRDQLVKMNFFGGTKGNVPAANFSQRLISKMPGMARVYYSSSGSEANEKAYKIVRQIAHQKYGGKKYKILYRDRDYHGTTITALSSGGHEQRKALYGPYTPGFVEVPHCLEYRSQWGDVDDYGIRAANAIEEVILREGADTVGGLILEAVTAGGGVITPPNGYWERVQEICKKYDILLIIDEVVCGMGRTGGQWFGYQHYGIEPDIVTMAKGVASGYAAISCTVTTEKVFNQFKSDPSDDLNYFRDISTFGGCTAGPAAALENMRILEDENLVENAEIIGAHLMEHLERLKGKYHQAGDARGKGLFCGLELVKDRNTKEPVDETIIQQIVGRCFKEHAVVIGMANRSLPGLNNTLFFAPALISTKSDIDEMIEALDESLNFVLNQ